MAKVTVDDKALQKRLALISARAKDSSGFTKPASIQMHRDVIDHFSREAAPSGKWKAWSTKYAEARAKGRGGSKILVDTGILRGSIAFSNTSKTATVGTNTEYAATHNYGDSSRNIPKREFMWLSPKLITNLAEQFTKYVAGVI